VYNTDGKYLTAWERLLELPHSRGHFVQFYEAADASFTASIGHYLWQGLRRGDGVLVIATPEHRDLFSDYLVGAGADITEMVRTRQLILLDAQDTLAQFMIGGQPDWHRFEEIIGAATRQVQSRPGHEGLRAYGEMVGVLWKARQFAAAGRLEQLWNRMLERSSFSLYCAYAIDVFGESCDLHNLEAVLCSHTHVVSTRRDGALEAAVNRSMDEILGTDADATRAVIGASRNPAWAVMPNVESTVFWLRRNMPDHAPRILERARHHYEAGQSPDA
jgi:hypothetical protein